MSEFEDRPVVDTSRIPEVPVRLVDDFTPELIDIGAHPSVSRLWRTDCDALDHGGSG